ncbi:hypothetical protein SRHO_G00109640 [Serrasalmus rhombeus]
MKNHFFVALGFTVQIPVLTHRAVLLDSPAVFFSDLPPAADENSAAVWARLRHPSARPARLPPDLHRSVRQGGQQSPAPASSNACSAACSPIIQSVFSLP